ncbi:MAG: cupin domain-containing protein [Prevotellaceae bacterium]|jgi:quercetin dioxygenase-like cupin family protein|nr:cupin domain-containing protein [Prevotellaceae bacterium]
MNKNKQTRSNSFLIGDELPWESGGEGIRRQVMGYDGQLMLVKVAFATGAVGTEHTHYHSQSTYVACGLFELNIDGEKKTLRQGDGYYIAPDIRHSCLCLEAGILIDCFSPVRADFLNAKSGD